MKMFSADIPKKLDDLDKLVRDGNYNLLLARNTLTKYIAFEYCLLSELKDLDTLLEKIEVYDIYETLRRKANGETDELKSKRIDFLLDKDKKRYTEPEFFRPCGPQWIDLLQKDYIIDRTSDVNNILELFKSKKVLAISGQLSSGKSVLLKQLSHHIINKYKFKDIYYYNLNHRSNIDHDYLYLSKLKDAFVFIDNAHRNRNYVEILVSHLEKQESNVKYLISTRDSYSNPYMSLFPKLQSLLHNSVIIKPNIISVRLIRSYLKRIGKAYVYDAKENIFTLDNLLLLVWELKAFGHYGSIKTEYLVKEAYSYVEKIRWHDLSGRSDLNQFSDLLLMLSIFSIFEIPVLENFLIHHFNISQGLIDSLIDLNEILSFSDENNNRYLSIPHSMLAKLYIMAFSKSPLPPVDNNSDFSQTWINALYNKYIDSYPEEIPIVLRRTGPLGCHFDIEKDLFNKGILIKSMSDHVLKHEKYVFMNIVNQPSLREILYTYANLQYFYGLDEKNVKYLFEKICDNIDIIADKIYDPQNRDYVHTYLSSIKNHHDYAGVNTSLIKSIFQKINIHKLCETIDQSPNNIMSLFNLFMDVDHSLGRSFLDKIDLNKIDSYYKKNKVNLQIFNEFIVNYSKINCNLAILFIKAIDNKSIIEAINSTNDIGHISQTLDILASSGKDKANAVMGEIDIDLLCKYINRSNDMFNINNITGVSP